MDIPSNRDEFVFPWDSQQVQEAAGADDSDDSDESSDSEGSWHSPSDPFPTIQRGPQASTEKDPNYSPEKGVRHGSYILAQFFLKKILLA